MTNKTPPDPKSNVDDVAGEWLVRLQSPKCTGADELAFKQWRASDPAHDEAYERLTLGDAIMDRLIDEPELQALAQEALQETKPSLLSFSTGRAAAMVASLIMVVGLSVFLLPKLDKLPGAGILPDLTAAEPKVFATAIGERSTISLLDGSEVTLNADSKLEVVFDASQREVVLTRGQAYFRVAKDEARPFVVIANDRRIIAVGTEFDVRFREEGRVDVTLVEGRVDVETVSAKRAGRNKKLRTERLTLEPGEKLIDASASEPSIATAVIADETSWMSGKLVFRDTPLPKAVDELNLYSPRKIILAPDPRLNGLEVSGVFRAGRSYTFVGALEAAHPLKVTEVSETEVRLEWTR